MHAQATDVLLEKLQKKLTRKRKVPLKRCWRDTVCMQKRQMCYSNSSLAKILKSQSSCTYTVYKSR